MLPPKLFSGYVGMLQQYRWRGDINRARRSAIRYIRFQWYEDFQFENLPIPFTCPHPDCSIIFKKRGEWTDHAKFTCHDAVRDDSNKSSCYYSSNTIPEDIELLLKDMERDVLQKSASNDMLFLKLKDLYGKGKNKKRRKFETAFISQLENDPLYKHHCLARECWEFRTLTDWMADGF
jgi:hypothetical protein